MLGLGLDSHPFRTNITPSMALKIHGLFYGKQLAPILNCQVGVVCSVYFP